MYAEFVGRWMEGSRAVFLIRSTDPDSAMRRDALAALVRSDAYAALGEIMVGSTEVTIAAGHCLGYLGEALRREGPLDDSDALTTALIAACRTDLGYPPTFVVREPEPEA